MNVQEEWMDACMVDGWVDGCMEYVEDARKYRK